MAQIMQLQVRRDTAANWTSENPVLFEGEIGIETGVPKEVWHKIGDGSTAWADLDYYHGPPWVQALDFGSPDSVYDGAPLNPFFGIMGSAP